MTSTPSPAVASATSAQRRTLTSLRRIPGHGEQPRDHGVEVTALEGDLVGLDAASASSPARAMAGGEDGREVCGPEAAGLAAARARFVGEPAP